MIGALIGWMVLGLVAGFLARLLHPGRDSMSLLATMVLGILGSLLGGGVSYLLNLARDPYTPGGWIMATIGAIVLLAFGWFGSRSRATL
ncbi:GlsB/YeaQ/YmgE family stress response membrane protein [Tundrisphaera sp. TA3]|uniref:GlsB/YeaQ/YmgE family stress response membrane protein n=1 Tax=Tundrisphaera sp. TA3 TaxID=3435775 RepID=UPI003EB95601